MKKKKKSTQIYSTPWIKHSNNTAEGRKKKTLINNNRWRAQRVSYVPTYVHHWIFWISLLFTIQLYVLIITYLLLCIKIIQIQIIILLLCCFFIIIFSIFNLLLLMFLLAIDVFHYMVCDGRFVVKMMKRMVSMLCVEFDQSSNIFVQPLATCVTNIFSIQYQAFSCSSFAGQDIVAKLL